MAGEIEELIRRDGPITVAAFMRLAVARYYAGRDPLGARGDFVVRNLMGVDQENGAIAVTDLVKVGQTMQFHVRDAATADEDLSTLLDPQRQKSPQDQPAGALLFSCNGRGTRMFGMPNHDIGLVNAAAKDCQVAGFFAAGEIGPVGDRTFIHGFTSSLILFSTPE